MYGNGKETNCIFHLGDKLTACFSYEQRVTTNLAAKSREKDFLDETTFIRQEKKVLFVKFRPWLFFGKLILVFTINKSNAMC